MSAEESREVPHDGMPADWRASWHNLQRVDGGFGGMKMRVNPLGGLRRDDGGERVKTGGGDAAETAEVFEQALAGARTNAGDGEQFRIAVAHFAALAVVGDGEAVGLVANALNQMEDG